MRKPRPQEYELPPMVVRQPASGWLETLENEVIIVQSLHTSKNAALRVQSKLTKESGETSLGHGAVVLIFGGVLFRVEPSESPYLMEKLFTEPAEERGALES
jgi:hypothetical protein